MELHCSDTLQIAETSVPASVEIGYFKMGIRATKSGWLAPQAARKLMGGFRFTLTPFVDPPSLDPIKSPQITLHQTSTASVQPSQWVKYYV